MAGEKTRFLRIMPLLMAILLLPCLSHAGASPGLIGRMIGSVSTGAVDYGYSDEEYQPLRVEFALSSDSLAQPGNCPASITLINDGDDVIGDVTLMDADGTILWGPRDLDLSGKYTWRGNIGITSDMLDKGEAVCKVSYVLAKGDKRYEQHITKEYSAAITRDSARPMIEFSRSQSMTYAQPGQSITLTYTVKNTGNVPLISVDVSDELIGEVGTLSELAIDEKKTFTKRVTVGESALSSKPRVTYSYSGSQDIVEKELAASSIKIAQPSLEVVLEADATLVNPGDTVMLRCKLINNGNVGYRKVQLSDQVLGDLGFIDDLRAGKDTVYAKAVRISSKTTFKFTITANDTTGSDVTAVSNSLTIDVVNQADEGSLTLSAQPDRTTVAEGEAVNFTLVLCNSGASDIYGIELSERTRGFIAHINQLRAGETMPITASYTVTGYEMFTFSASMTQHDGAKREALAGPITIQLGEATPTEAPTPAPTAIPAATIAPGVMRAYNAVFNHIITIVLAVSVCIVIVLIVMVMVSRSQRKPGAKRRGRHSRRGKSAPPPADVPEDDVKVYIPTRKLREGSPERSPDKPGRHDRRAN